jgi:hypothetical protein
MPEEAAVVQEALQALLGEPVRLVLRQNLRAILNPVRRHRLFSRMKNQLQEK